MRRHTKSACTAAIAMVSAVALTAGPTSPASAISERVTGVTGAAGLTGFAGVTGVGGVTAADLAPGRRITLVTGDRVLVDAGGRVLGLERAKGREGVPLAVREADGHTYVLPADAARLISAGRVDRRLFDITALNTAASRAAQKQGLKLIVGYTGTAAGARAGVRAAGDTKVRRTLRTLNAEAVLTPGDDAAALWKAVTDADGTTATGIAHLWLDGVREVTLDRSVARIGAPKAWKAGFDGKGVTIAVLDTGVDATHPDLKGQVKAAKNFSTSPDTTDKYGHGTHVASIAAGTGAGSRGRYRGVAPRAKLLNGKVLGDEGFGDDSGIVAGMEWAAAQGADVVNLSLGGGDTPEIDPMEAAINKLSAEKGILFAVAAGNEGDGGAGTVGSPGSAAAALTVGAVDDKDRLASFSSRGPTLDGRIKPDVTAPGVAITAAAAPGSVIEREVGQKPKGYLTISGTSMATPHVAGAAALLKQQHPKWTYAELKAALVASAKGGAYTPFEQGSGRIRVDRAIKQKVLARPVSVDFGVHRWPHTDDKPVARKLTYKNLGTKAVTLTLAVSGMNPKGKPAPAGFFKLGARKVTVPARGRATVDLIVNTRLGGNLDGAYSAYVTAKGGGQGVRTAAAVQREAESYDVTLRTVGRDGAPAVHHVLDLTGVSGLARDTWFTPYDQDGTVDLRVPEGDYILNAGIVVDPDDAAKGVDWLARPTLTVDRRISLTLDARTTKPVDITVPDPAAQQVLAAPEFALTVGGVSYSSGWLLDTYAGFRTAHLGPRIAGGRLSQTWAGQWTGGGTAQYATAGGGKAEKLATGCTKHWKKDELATVRTGLGASGTGRKGAVLAWAQLPGGSGAPAVGVPQPVPGKRTLYLSAANGVSWVLDFEQYGAEDEQGFPLLDAYYTTGDSRTFKAGRTYAQTFNVGIFGPRIAGSHGIRRDGAYLYGLLPMVADGRGHAGASVYEKVTTTLYRDGEKFASGEDALDGSGQFELPAGRAAYRLTTSLTRPAELARASSRIDASWTFTSEKTARDTKMPVSTVRFGAPFLGLDSTAPAGGRATVRVTVQGAAAGDNLRSLSVYVSGDGRKWTEVALKKGAFTHRTPAAGKSVSLRAEVTDKQGNTSTVTIHDAYFGR
ncbi:S8 family peptidase [Streptomyces stelliscabiei]|uniref:S8 family peptidase n=1 Tax=Streptomyces stelliscabiei TaxID=146820 RepID=UPI0029A4F8B1|nr:S8 family peptidase [Streptomyces stelliscabiei]MDX2549757.1 S8 family peptidase [Streptomyces stelliscabiei]MDX2616188.1 S8 family peptidase [Streptomyces stelliscabiei]MDX2634124.1 S8 family peptidase [Streptomyces stelliscabiei]MDX2664665.1 S8 family peptidase [Streptomyces stelliscabiei]MDX2713772.1 S8 family peptidase [Streptomyces stelliscabiei]